MTSPTDLSTSASALLALITLCGGVVRGFGGFGASMVWVTGMSIVLSPAAAVPIAMLLEVLASLQLLPSVWQDAHWRSLSWLLLGYVVGLPFGTWALVAVPDRPMTMAVAVAMLLAAAGMASGWQRDELPGPRATVGTGTASGVLNGAFGLAGPPAIVLYFSASGRPGTGRASLIMFFLCTDVLGTASSAMGGLVTWELAVYVLLLFPVSLLGVRVGARWYARTPTDDFRRYVLALLVVLACVTFVDALV